MSRAGAASGEEIPTGHPIYPLLRRLETAEGLLPLFSRTEPLTRREVLEALYATEVGRAGAPSPDPGDSLGPSDAAPPPRARAPVDTAWAAGLRRELYEELALDEPAPLGRSSLTARTGLRSRFEVDVGGTSRLRETLRLELGADLTRWLCLFESIELDTHGERDSDFSGQRWRDALTARVDRAGIAVDTKHFGLVAGRSASRWGEGEPGGLLLSPASPPLDLVRLRFDLGRARLASQFSALDAQNTPLPTRSRTKSATSPPTGSPCGWRSLDLGLSESIVYGGVDRGLEPFYMNPLLLFYAEQWNHLEKDNVLWGADFFWTPRAGRALKGELLVDDFQFDMETEPHQIGWTVGGEWAFVASALPILAAAEYTRIETFVYGHSTARNRYTNEGVGLGHPLGPDADRVAATLTCDPSENLTVALAAEHARHGAQTIDTPQDEVNPKGLGFPSPPVQERLTVDTTISWRPRVTRRLDARITYASGGNQRSGWSGSLAATFRFDRRFLIGG